MLLGAMRVTSRCKRTSDETWIRRSERGVALYALAATNSDSHGREGEHRSHRQLKAGAVHRLQDPTRHRWQQLFEGCAAPSGIRVTRRQPTEGQSC
jgi:hypothetical protein